MVYVNVWGVDLDNPREVLLMCLGLALSVTFVMAIFWAPLAEAMVALDLLRYLLGFFTLYLINVLFLLIIVVAVGHPGPSQNKIQLH